MSNVEHIFKPLIKKAIREQRILAITHVLVSGYEMSTQRVRWREVHLSTIESARPTEYTLAR